jgi:tetratricopeptide (TPR) repeat protein
MRVFIFLLAVLVPMMATAAERSDSAETRLRLVEIELKALKDSAKDEATRVETRLLDRVDHLESSLSQQNSHLDHILAQLNLSIAIGGIFIAAVALLGAWKAVLIAKAEARDALREMLDEIKNAKAEVEALLKEVRQGHGEVMSKVAEIMAADIAPEDYTPDQQASIAVAAQQAAAKPESERTKIDHWALAQQAILAGDSGKAADHLARADETKPWTWVLRAQVKLSQGDEAGARQDGETALRLSREQQSRKDEAIALDILEKVYRSSADWPQAKAVSMDTLQINRELVAADPGNPRHRLNLAVSLGNLAQRCLQMKDVAEARGYATEAVTISRVLHDDNPDWVNPLDQLALSYAILGTVCMQEEKWTEAKAALTVSMRFHQELLGRNPANTKWLHQSALCWNRLGMLARGQLDWAQARACAVEYRVLTERLASLDPHNVEWQVSVVFARRDNADCDWRLGHLEIAQAGYLAAIQRLEALEGQGKLSAQAKILLGECRRKLADLEKQMAEKGDV